MMKLRWVVVLVMALTVVLLEPTVASAAHCERGYPYIDLHKIRTDEWYCMRHGFLGPFGWWWNTIRFDILGDNTTAMVLLGWELFFLPMGAVMGVLFFLALSIYEGAKSILTPDHRA